MSSATMISLGMARWPDFDRARTAWIDAIALSPHGDDFNGDLRRFGIDGLRATLRVQLAPEDVARFTQL
jgi:hypothetical protein